MKKVLFFLLFALFASNVAQSQNLKERIGTQKAPQSKEIKLFAQNKNKQQNTEAKLLTKNKQQNAKASTWAAKFAAKQSRSSSEYNFIEVTGFPYELSTIFNETNATSFYEGHRSFIFKFTITETTVLNIKTEEQYLDMGVFSDESLNINSYVTDGTNIIEVFVPGTYYIVAPDFGGLFEEDGEFPVHFMIDDLTSSATSVTVPFDDDITLTSENTFDYYDATVALYQFTLTEPQMLHFTISECYIKIPGYYSFDNDFERLFAAGTHYFLVMNFENNIPLTASMTISINESADIQTLQIPGQKSITMTNDNTLENGYGEKYQIYSFSLNSNKAVSFSTKSPEPYFDILNSNGISISNDYRNGCGGILSAGDYFLIIYDDYFLQYNTSLNFVLTSEFLTPYPEIEYLPLLFGATKSGNESNTTPNVYIEGEGCNAAGYHFEVKAGHLYTISFSCFLEENGYAAAILLGDPMTGNLYYDMLALYSEENSAKQFTGSFTYLAKEDGDVNLLLVFLKENGSFFYTVKVEEEMMQKEEFNIVEISLPFASHLYFHPEYNTKEEDDQLIKIFKLVLEEETRIYYTLGFSPLSIYKNEELTDFVVGDFWEGKNFVLEAGTYYLVFTDDYYYDDYEEYYDCFVKLEKFDAATLTLEDLLTNAEITTVSYISDLPYTDAGYFIKGFSDIVEGDGDLFKYSYGAWFVKAYKLTGMEAGDVVNIYNANSNDAYLYIYTNSTEDGIEMVTYNDDYGDSYDSYIELTASKTCDYYIVATTYGSYNDYINTTYQVAIWKDGEMPELDEPQYPIVAEIVSTTASATEISVASDITPTDLQAVLMQLDITATLDNAETMSISNNPFAWTYDAEITEAYYTNIDILGYEKAENYQPATVSITYIAGLNEQTLNNLTVFPNPAVETLNISGLSGTEKINIIDMNGKIVVSTKAAGETAAIAVSGLVKGVYLVTVQNDKQVNVLKFIKK